MLSMKKSNTCSWCFKPTDLPEVFAAEVPILEWMENKIDKYCNEHDISREELWGETSDWNSLDLDEGWVMELLSIFHQSAFLNLYKDFISSSQPLTEGYIK